jgi:hypothetical protein
MGLLVAPFWTHAKFKSKPSQIQHHFSRPLQEAPSWKFDSVFIAAARAGSDAGRPFDLHNHIAGF